MARPTDTEIDDRIEEWHNGRFADGIGLPLALGWSQDEYDRFVADPSAVPDRPLRTPDEVAAIAYQAIQSARGLTGGARPSNIPYMSNPIPNPNTECLPVRYGIIDGDVGVSRPAALAEDPTVGTQPCAIGRPQTAELTTEPAPDTVPDDYAATDAALRSP